MNRSVLHPRRISLLPAAVFVALLAAGWSNEAPAAPAGHHYHDASAPAGRLPVVPRDGAAAKVRSVIGADDRVPITDTTSYPFSAVAFLELIDAEGYVIATCTGTFIGPDALLTAGHCLWDSDIEDWSSEHIRVVPGKDQEFEPFGSEYATDWWVPDAYAASGSPEWDWGVIKLADDFLALDTGWLPIALLTTAMLQQPGFNPAIVGYPGEMPEGTMWGHTQPFFHEVGAFELFYDIDTTAGQSGSAIWSLADGPTLGYIVGLHTHGAGIGDLNSGSRIDAELLDDLLTACEAMVCAIEYYIEDAEPQPSPSPDPTPEPTPEPTPQPAPEQPPLPPLPFRIIGPQLSRD